MINDVLFLQVGVAEKYRTSTIVFQIEFIEKLAVAIIIVQQLHKYFQENLPFYNVPQSKNHTTKLIDVFLRNTHNSLCHK